MITSGISVQFGKRHFKDVDTGLDYAAREVLKAWEENFPVVKGELLSYLKFVAKELAQRHGTQWPGGTSPDSLSVRSGRAKASILRSVKVTGTTYENLRGYIGGNHYLTIHEFGGVIRARDKLLTIPLPAALSKRGTSPPFARQWKNTFVARSRKGNLIIFQRRGDDIVPLYVLKKQVYIPPRLGMYDTLDENFPYFLMRTMDAVAQEFQSQLRST